MSKKASLDRLKLSTFKLNALLEVTMAINENLAIDDLLQRYEKILKEELNIGKIAIYKYSEGWECIFTSGLHTDCSQIIDVEKDLLPFNEITPVTSYANEHLSEFDIVIPVISKDSTSAFVLIGDIDEEAEGVSPIIKHLHFIQTLSNIIIVAIENIRLFEESLRQEAIRREMELASKMQNMLIPDALSLPDNEFVKFTAFYHPHYDVGGDYYDCITLNEKEVGFCIADVSGKGLSAAILMSNFQANLQALFTAELPLPELVERLNERVIKNAKGERFITLFLARFNYETKELEYINAAHNPPLLYAQQSGDLKFLESNTVGIGMLDEIPNITSRTLTVGENAKLFCYTDGLVELVGEKEVEVGTRIIESHLRNNDSMSQNIQSIINEMNILSGSNRIFDDITILGVEIMKP